MKGKFLLSTHYLPWTSEKIFSIELCVAKVTFNFSDKSEKRSPWIAKSNTLYILRWSHRPNFKLRPEKTAFSLMFPLLSDNTYSKHAVAGVRIEGALSIVDVGCWSLFKWCPQSDCNKRSVRKTFEMVKASTLTIEKFRRRHGVYSVEDKVRKLSLNKQ